MIAIHRQTVLPVKNLQAADFSVDVDGAPQPFQLSRPWAGAADTKTGQPKDRPNLLIILPLDAPVYRKNVLQQAIQDLGRQPDQGWNISILDDGGEQTAYTRDQKSVIADLERIQKENPPDLGLDEWRSTASLAISSMRDLPGRRVVMTLGDIYHEVVIDEGELVYENYEVDDMATAARNAGAVMYAAYSSLDITQLRGLYPYFSLLGPGPWLLMTEENHVAGWICDTVRDTLDKIRQDGAGAYDIDLHLGPKQLDGQIHVVSITAHGAETILSAPPYYIAPDLAALKELAGVSPALRQALKIPPAADALPLELATQLAYFPHPDGKTGTQIATTGFFWTQGTAPPPQLQVALQLEQTSSGFILNTTVGRLTWSTPQPVWNTEMNVGPGAYMLRVAAGDAAGKTRAAVDTPFTIEPTTDETVLISSLVLGKSCVFSPPPAPGPGGAKPMNYLRAGNCNLMPDPGHYYSPQDIAWTLVRITPVGKLAGRPSKSWKGSFEITDAKGSKLVELPAEWLPGEDGSFVATAAFPLDNPKLKLANGEYAVVFRLKGPGIERGYGEDAPFLVYGVDSAAAEPAR